METSPAGSAQTSELARADKRVKRLQGANFVAARTQQYSRMEQQIKMYKDKLSAIFKMVKETLDTHGKSKGSDKALDAYIETCHLAVKFCEAWLTADRSDDAFRKPQEPPLAFQPVTNLGLLRTHKECLSHLERTLQFEKIEPLDQHGETWKKYYNTLGEFARFASKATGDVSNYANQKIKNAKKDEDRLQKDTEKKAIDSTREKARAVAEQVKDSLKAKVVPAIFCGDLKVLGFKPIKEVSRYVHVLVLPST